MGQQAKHKFNVVSSGAPSKKPKLAQVRQQKTLSFGDEEDEGGALSNISRWSMHGSLALLHVAVV